MSEDGSRRLPSLPWQHETSVSRNFWVVENPPVVIAAVYEVGRFERCWIFYRFVNGRWVKFVEFGRVGVPEEGIHPYFGRIFGYFYDVDPSSDNFLVVERGDDHWWWLFYIRLRFGGFLLLFAIQAVAVTVVHEGRALEMSDDDSDESSVFGQVPIVFDI